MKLLSPTNTIVRPNSSLFFRILLILLVLLPTSLIAQKKIVARTLDKSRTFSLSHIFKNYSLFSIDPKEISTYARSNAQNKFNMELDLPTISPLNMELNTTNILSSDYRLTIAGPQGKTELGKPATTTCSGKLSGDDSSSIYLTLSDQIIFGFIREKGKEYFIEPLKYFGRNTQPGQFVVYEAKDIVPHPGLTCGAAELEQRKQQITNGTSLRASGTCSMVEMAIASDAGMVARYGTAFDVQERNIGLMNMMVGIYHNAQIGTQYLEFTITGQYVAVSSDNDPMLPAYSGSDGNIMLQNFNNWGEAGGFGLHYDLGQFWTATDFSFGTVGLAWIGGICTDKRYQLLEDFSGSSLAKAVVAAHETGHNLNAQHDAPGDPYIMAPSITDPPYTTFSPSSLSTMSNFLNAGGGSCLSSCSRSSFVVQISTSADAICINNSITFTDNSVGGALGRNWNFGAGANPSSSTNETETVRYSTPGVKTVQLSSFGQTGGGTLLKNYYVFSGVRPACQTKTDAPYADVALTSFALAKISHKVDPVYIGPRFDEDLTCSDMTSLSPGISYTASVGLGWPSLNISSKIQVLIDYNNDGDFLDENESVYYSEECQQGNYSFIITTPQTVPVVNTLLRMRVIALPCSVGATDGCTIPSNCQVFDFGVYFPECASPVTYYKDADGDGYGSSQNPILACQPPVGYVTNNRDCDDQDPLKNPATKWIKDADGDGYYPGNPITQCSSPGTGYIILTNQLPGDCDDSKAELNPATVWVLDSDGDGYFADTFTGCSGPAGYKISSGEQPGDCDDSKASVNPGIVLTITAPPSTSISTDAGACTASNVSLGDPILSNNCSVLTVTNDAPAIFTKGATTVVWTVKDTSGHSATSSQIITVNDNENPIITNCPTPLLLCYNSDGNYTIPGLLATDNCGVASISYVITGATSRSGSSGNASGLFNPGTSTITWTVTDAADNSVTCTSSVTIDKVEATIPDVYAPGITSTIGSTNTIYLGYGGSSVTLTAQVTGNLTPNSYTYKWTTGSPAGPGFASTPSVTVSPSSSTSYFVSIKDQNNCAQTVQVNKLISVIDIRCGTDKIYVCGLKKGTYSTSCVSSSVKTISSLPAGSYLGACVPDVTTRMLSPQSATAALEVQAAPNPANTHFRITITSSDLNSPVKLVVTDVLGRVMETRTAVAGQVITIGEKYINGIYLVRIAQGKEARQLKLIKISR